VEIRARVSGYLDKNFFKDGELVAEGAPLFLIDERPYRAELDRTTAALAQAEAHLERVKRQEERARRLFEKKSISQEDFDTAMFDRAEAEAAAGAASAQKETAALNLSFTKINAKISGRISRRMVDPGNLVQADVTPLTTIVSIDPMYAYFDVDEPTVLRVQQLIREGKYKTGSRVPVFLGLSNEQDYPQVGYVDFVNNQVSPSTGTLQVRGTFSNPKPPLGPRVLSPGLFVRIRVAISPPYQALLVVQSAIETDQNLKFVYVVNEQNEVERRDVTLGAEEEYLQVIATGVKADDRVVVNGLQHVRPGMVVNAKLVPMPTPSTSSLPSTPSTGTTPPAKGQPQAAPSMQQNYPPRGQPK
jgi:RND family efflux transporter MFP subunit